MKTYNVILIGVALWALYEPSAHGQSASPEQEARFQNIYQMISANDYAKATELLTLTCARKAVPLCDYYSGVIHRGQNHELSMADAYERYLSKTIAETTEQASKRRQRVQQDLDTKIRPKYGRLMVDAQGTSFRVDDGPKEVGPCHRWLEPGEHKIRFEGQKDPLNFSVQKGMEYPMARPLVLRPSAKKEKKDLTPIGEPDLNPALATQAEIVLDTDLGGTLVEGLKGYEKGLTIHQGKTHVIQRPGPFRLVAKIPGMMPLEASGTASMGETQNISQFNWKDVVKRGGRSLSFTEWNQLAATRQTPKAYMNREKNMAMVTAGTILLLGGLAAAGLIMGICGERNGTGDPFCDPGFGAGFVIGAGFALGGAILVPIGARFLSEKMPEPGRDALGNPTRGNYY